MWLVRTSLMPTSARHKPESINRDDKKQECLNRNKKNPANGNRVEKNPSIRVTFKKNLENNMEVDVECRKGEKRKKAMKRKRKNVEVYFKDFEY